MVEAGPMVLSPDSNGNDGPESTAKHDLSGGKELT